jgi:flagellar biosynthesis GTPase FlhF
MFVKKFEGESLDEALQSVKRELGPDAIILKTVTNKGLKGAFKKSRIEITAAISEQTYEKKAKVDHVLTEPQREEFYKAPASRINNMIDDFNDHTTPESSSSQVKRSGSYGNMGLNKVVNSVSKASNKIKNSLDDFLTMEEESSTPASASFDQFIDEEISAPIPQRAPQQVQESYSTSVDETQMVNREEIAEQKSYFTEVSNELKEHIKSQSNHIEVLEQKLFALTEKMAETRVDTGEAQGLRGLRNSLRTLDLKESIIQKVIKKATFELTPGEQDDADTVYDFALREMNSMINVEMPLFSSADIQGAPVITVLLSESSCGQSSMAMKLAVIQENVKIIRFRDHTIDQVNSDFTAQVFKMDIATVDTLSHLMSEARKATEEGKSIILDLKLNFKENDETKKFIETIKRSFDNVEFLVTLSGIQSEIYNRKILTKYNSFSNGVIISYIDQCLSFGQLVNVHDEFSNKPLKFYGTGPTVPDDIEAATAERILAGMFQL